ncbi:MAG: hypothetical protein ACI81V_000302 [Lentimonas sp.]|jgi:hypothetical protein
MIADRCSNGALSPFPAFAPPMRAPVLLPEKNRTATERRDYTLSGLRVAGLVSDCLRRTDRWCRYLTEQLLPLGSVL